MYNIEIDTYILVLLVLSVGAWPWGHSRTSLDVPAPSYPVQDIVPPVVLRVTAIDQTFSVGVLCASTERHKYA